MASRESFGNGGGGQGTSPSDRAIAAYEERFFQTANSNDSKRRMLEERMTRPTPSTGITAGDALNASNVGANDQPDSDDDEQNAFRVEPKRARRGPGGSGHANNGARGVATSPLGDKERATPGSAGGRGSIDTYYKRVDGVPPAPAFGTSPTHGVGGIPTPASGSGGRKENYPPGSVPPEARHARTASHHDNTRAEHEWAAALEQAKAGAKREADEARKRASRLETDLAAAAARCEELAAELEASREREASAEAARHQRDQNKTAGVIALAVKVARFERTRSRRKLAEDGLRLGTVSVQRSGTVLQEVWEDGGAFRDLNSRAAAVQTAKDAADDERKRVKGRLPLPGAAIDESEERALRAEFVLSEEAHKVRVAALKREEDLIGREREALEREKSAHIRELKRARDEDSSRFNQHPLLGDRYVLMNMLGRGGFSEVYKAYDVLEMREVACKLHQLNPQWSEQRKVTYVKHAARECEIHKQLRHPSVVQLIDVFEVDQNCFCTVLELCTGDDLDARLKAQGAVSEREARAILAQVFAGLAYMNSGSTTVIHYDLKPGNILFDAAGRVKITDFGLSKKRDMNGVQTLSTDTGMELTSQGAGTYWYLPPECFETGPTPPKISSKVDTWSCGVILYQMLFNRRPFGHDQSQEQILHAGTIRHAKEVEFPQTPKVSAECKEFIKRCLAYRKEDRPDVPTAARDPYMTYAKPGSE